MFQIHGKCTFSSIGTNKLTVDEYLNAKIFVK